MVGFSNFILKSNDLISFFLVLEITSFIITGILFLNQYALATKEAGFKYFFLHALSSSCLILTLILFIFIFKTTNYINLIYFFLFSSIFFKVYVGFYYLAFLFNIALVTLFVFIFFKFSIFPFHFWIVSFYEATPLVLLLFFSTFYKLYVLHFFFKMALFLIFKVPFFVYISILVSILYGAHMAFLQKKIRRY